MRNTNQRLFFTVPFTACLCCMFCDVVAKAGEPKTITNSIGMKLVLIPKGKFQMGSPQREKGSRDDERLHEVTLSRDYYLGAFEVTQAQYLRVMGKNPSYFKELWERPHQAARLVQVDTSNHPVDWVSWEDAVNFCKKLSALPQEQKAGRVYRLPTEAEWEYACRAGSTSAYSFGNDERSLVNYGWYSENSERQTHPVGKRKANAWGLYDMHGNVWEWCADWYADYSKWYGTDSNGSVGDPVGPMRGRVRVRRGGGWFDGPASCRSANRDHQFPGRHYNNSGFRVALHPPSKTPE